MFAQRCAVCHGPDGKGKRSGGTVDVSTIPVTSPLEFFKYKSTAAGEAPTDDDLLRTIRDGLPASAMPYFAGLLSNEELTNGRCGAGEVVFNGVLPGPEELHRNPRFGSKFAAERDPRKGDSLSAKAAADVMATTAAAAKPSTMGLATECSPAILPRHGHSGVGAGPWTHLAAVDHRHQAGAHAGLLPDVLSADARWDLANFVVSLARTPPWEDAGSFGGAGFAEDPSRLGGYLTRWEMCGLCHTQIERSGIYNVDGADSGRRHARWLLSARLLGEQEPNVRR